MNDYKGETTYKSRRMFHDNVKFTSWPVSCFIMFPDNTELRYHRANEGHSATKSNREKVYFLGGERCPNKDVLICPLLGLEVL